jgi:NADH:ubiquinone oxidoreductase subunit 3 (subunit A)
MTLTSSITNAVVILIIVVVVIGVALGVAISGADLLNPRSSEAERDRVYEVTRHEREMNLLEEQESARAVEIKLALLPIREYALAAAEALALVIVAVGLAFLLIKLGYHWSSQTGDVWKEKAYRDTRIQLARENERYFREAFSAPPVVQAPPIAGGDGHRPGRAPFGMGSAGQRSKHHLTPAEAAG